MEVRAQVKYIGLPAKKVRVIADSIRGRSITESIDVLKLMPNSGAKILKKLLESAVANADSAFSLSAEDLEIGQLYIDEGPTMKRFRPRAMGRASRIRKRSCHATVILKEKGDSTNGSES